MPWGLVFYVIENEIAHFVFSGFMGVLGWWVTLTTLGALAWRRNRVTGERYLVPRVVPFIRFMAVLVGLLLGLWAHSQLDLFLDWWLTPLGPPLGG